MCRIGGMMRMLSRHVRVVQAITAGQCAHYSVSATAHGSVICEDIPCLAEVLGGS